MNGRRTTHLAEYWPVVLTAILCALATWGVGTLARLRDLAELEASTLAELHASQIQLARVAESTFAATAGLETLLYAQGGLDERSFNAAVDRLLRDQTQLRNVVAAPGNVVTHVHPLRGNERVVGLDYRSVPAQWAQIERARTLHQPLIFAPVPLVQGGMGVVQRRPIFLTDGDGDERYWGTVSAVADLNQFAARAGLPDSRLTLTLVERRADGQFGAVIWGEIDLRNKHHVREDLQLPGATWSLLGSPREGWVWRPTHAHWMWLTGLAAVVLVSMSVMLSRRRLELAQRRLALQQESAERLNSQRAAEEANARLQALLNTASDWLWEQDAELRLTYLSLSDDSSELSRAVRGVLGGLRWEHPLRVIGKPRQAVWQAHQQQLGRREPFRNFEYALRATTGGLLWVSISGEPVFTADGRFAGYRGTGRDVTAAHDAADALRRANQELGDARDRLQAVLDAAVEVAIIATDANDCITLFNRGAERMLGYSPSEVLGKPPYSFHDPQEIAERLTALSQALGRPITPHELFTRQAELQGTETRTWTLLRRDGTPLLASLSISPIHDTTGQPLGYLGVAVDISAQQRAETELRSSASRLQAVFDSADAVAILVLDPDWRISSVNRGAQSVLGCAASEAVGLSMLDFHLGEELQVGAGAPAHTPQELLAQQAAGEPNGHTRLWTLRRRDTGALVRVSHTSTRLLDANGAHLGYVAIARDITAEERTQELLDEERARMASVLAASIDVAVIATDVSGRITIFSRGAEHMLGYKAEDMLGRSPMRLHLQEEVDASARTLSAELGRPVAGLAHFAALAQVSAARRLVWSYRRKDGSLIKVSQVLTCLRDAHGAVSGYLGVMSDITEQMASDQALRDANARLQAMLDASLEVGILLLDIDGRVLAFNRGSERLFGIAASDVLGQSTEPLHEPDELAKRLDVLHHELGRPAGVLDLYALQAQNPPGFRTREWTFIRHDGSRLRASLSMAEIRDERSFLLGYLGMCRDIGPQLAQEQQLREARDRLQAVLDGALEVGIIVTDSAGRITLFNRGAERLFGYAQHEVLARHSDMLQDRQELEQRRQTTEPGAAVELGALSHWTFVRKSGERFTGALRLSPLLPSDGSAPSRLAIVLDISEQLRAQQGLEQLNRELEERVAARGAELRRTLSSLTQAQDELLRAERMAALGSLVAGVAHELNTPLGTCLTAASSLQERTRELRHEVQDQKLRRSTLDAYAADAEAMSDLLLRGLRNACDLVTHFKQLSVDQTSEQRRPFELATVVADVLTVMRPLLKHSRLRIESQIDITRMIDAYPGELGRLLTNLIQNAQVHAFDAGTDGRLRIVAKPLDPEHFELEVSDNGRGMSAEVRRRAFDPFFTTKLGSGGSGLGLNIVFNIATGVLGGEVSLHSEPGHGTRFVFRLPYVAPHRREAGAFDQLDG